jgi:SAM-dependent methyltransferase
MIENRLEYQRMYDVEQKLWWYRSLHGKVLKQIEKRFSKPADQISVLDAACGTGGLLTFLKKNGFQNMKGFDYSSHAIDFSRDRNLDVEFGDLRAVDAYHPEEKFDVICCNDALYFLSDEEIIAALTVFKKRLHENGIAIINIHAFEAFSGTHDLAVGSSRRFEFADFQQYAAAAGLRVKYKTYWPFALSLPILAVRQWQKYQIRKNKVSEAHADSDVSYPGDAINSLLSAVMNVEQFILPSAPFGSSLFLVLE